MDDETRAHQVMANKAIKAVAARAALREALRREALPGRSASPRALEATLAGISGDVTAKAIERRRNQDGPR